MSPGPWTHPLQAQVGPFGHQPSLHTLCCSRCLCYLMANQWDRYLTNLSSCMNLAVLLHVSYEGNKNTFTCQAFMFTAEPTEPRQLVSPRCYTTLSSNYLVYSSMSLIKKTHIADDRQEGHFSALTVLSAPGACKHLFSMNLCSLCCLRIKWLSNR